MGEPTDCSCQCHTTFKTGERVAAYDWMGRALGRGRVVWIQPPGFHGPYMKVLLDTKQTVTVPMHTSKRLVRTP